MARGVCSLHSRSMKSLMLTGVEGVSISLRSEWERAERLLMRSERDLI